MSETAAPTILIVEDEVLIRDLMEAALEDGGFSVTFAESGPAALERLDELATALAAVVTDVDLGRGPDGWEVARHARRLNAELPIVYMSGGSAHAWTAEGVPNSTMLRKPFAPAQLVVAIASLINASDAHA